MSNFKTIEKLGLCLGYIGDDALVSAEELETLLQSAQVVYGGKGLPGDGLVWQEKQHNVDTHSALLIGITPLKKKTKAEAALEFVESLAKDTTKFWNVATLDEAKRILEMKDEV